MPRKIFIDTSAWLSFFIPTEKTHIEISRILSNEIKERSLVYTSNYVIDETLTRLIYDASWKTVGLFISHIEQSLDSKYLVKLSVDEQIESEALDLFAKYHEHKLSFTDATTVVLVKNFKIDSILSLDSDFVKLGLSVLPD